MATIAELARGDKAKILRLEKGESSYRQKLIALGLTPGTELEIKRIAPLGDPVEVAVRGFALILRKGEAGIILVEKLCNS